MLPLDRAAALRALLHRLSLVIIVFSIARIAAEQLAYVSEKGDAISEVADSNSEANAIRSAENFARNGFTRNYGLGDIAYGKQFPNLGAKIDLAYCGYEGGSYETCVYQHYPPGPDHIIAVLSRYFGIGRAGYFRVFPIGVGIASLIFFAVSLARLLGPVRAAIVVALLSKLPLTQNMMHGLHYQGYALSLLLVQLGVLMRIFFRPDGDKRWLFLSLFLLGHVQGWMSFDYCFLVTFSAIPIWLMAPDFRARPVMRHAFFAVLWAGLGFVFAHCLHFVQVMAYRGEGVHGLLEHFREVARARAGITNWDAELAMPGLFGLLVRYWTVLLAKPVYFDLNFAAWIAAMIAFFLAPLRRLDAMIGKHLAIRVRARASHLGALVAALVVSSIWIVMMRTHAFVHQHFIPRHYYLGFVVGVLAVLKCVTIEAREPPAEVPDGTP